MLNIGLSSQDFGRPLVWPRAPARRAAPLAGPGQLPCQGPALRICPIGNRRVQSDKPLCQDGAGRYLHTTMVHATTVALPPQEILARAKRFFRRQPIR